MKYVIAVMALVIAAGVFVGCSSCPNPCDPCVTAPVYQSPCCPAPSGGVDGNWGGAAAPAPAPAGGASCGGCGGGGACG
jgi:hypothetical protein